MNQSIRLNLEQIGNDRALLQLSSANGQDRHEFTLPWLDQREWNAVFWYLTAFRQYPETWPTNADTIKVATEMQLAASEGIPISGRIKRIGQQLYQALFGDGKCEQLFQRTLYNSASDPLLVELHFPEAGHYLQTYPWELLHDREDFLFDSLRATLVRYVRFGSPVNSIQVVDKLQVLLISPRPQMPPNYENLTLLDEDTLRTQLSDTNRRIQRHDLTKAGSGSTFSKMLETLNKVYPDKTHIIHIDAHGELNPQTDKPQTPEGYVAFADGKGNLEWVSGQKLGKALANRGVQLVVLSVCSSGTTDGGSVFNSVAGALIKRGIPAVVAMQFPVEEQSTRIFIQNFYQTLLNGAPLVQAVAAARTGLLAIDDAWYRPALYIRTDPDNMNGKIFDVEAETMPGRTSASVNLTSTSSTFPTDNIPTVATLRRQINQTFDDVELDSFCIDHFPQVYDKFSRGMRKDEKISLLLDYCRRVPERLDGLETTLREFS